jgi:SAM-dependent methyltransferase
MDSIYNDGTYLARNPAWHAPDSAWKADRVVRLLERHGIAPASVCEVGCGAGEVIAQVARRWPAARCSGYDVSAQAWAISSRKSAPGLDYRLGDPLDQPERFDVALAIDVVEHVEDYFGFLRRLRAKAAHKVFHIPLELSALWAARGEPLLRKRREVGHIHHFCRETALAALEDTGYRVLDHEYTPWATEIGRYGWKSSLLNGPRRALFAIDRDAAVRLLGGYSLLVLAE